ncbi:hypothetical protein H0W91_03510 [Patescibacteria group bacterium]|nr:hypothetical protein [Patescibacteria group bacterium]
MNYDNFQYRVSNGGFMRGFLAIVIALCAVVSTSAQMVTADPWEKLEQKKGWLILGVVKSTRNPLFLGLKEKLSWVSFIDFNVVDHSRTMPKVGDVVIVGREQDLLIINYQIAGEENVLISPTEHQVMPEDQTGVILPKGKKFKVNAVELSSGFGPEHLKIVWVLASRP